MTGTVKWFDTKKGYGFITADDGGRELFVHHASIEGKGFHDLAQGQRVEFTEKPGGKKGPRAESVRILEETT